METPETERFEPITNPRPRFVEHRQAIGAYFFEDPDALDIRHLWTRGTKNFFRVNFWSTDPESGEPRIRHSAFIVVEKNEEGCHVTERTISAGNVRS
ncbi:MAG: hypothetical protein HY763_00480 [Planctomycetes bacterium]|nr:hypothetical protein [Planctomycetota bacterium]